MLEDQQLYLGRLEVDMKFEPKNPPRKFKVGKLENNIVISDFGDLQLSPDEQITIVSENGKRPRFCLQRLGLLFDPFN